MKNCLVTTLPSEVQDNNLERLGELIFSVGNAVGRDINLSASAADLCTCKLERVTLRYDNVDYNNILPIALGPMNITIQSAEQSGIVRITNKYELDEVVLTRCTPYFTTKDVATTKLITFSVAMTDMEGDLMDLVNLPLTAVGISDTKITGDVTLFLDTMAEHRNNGDIMTIYVSNYCTNIPEGIGKSWATRGKVVFDGNGGYSITTP